MHFLLVIAAKQKKDNFYSELNRAMSTESARKMSRLGPDENFWRTIPDPSMNWKEGFILGLMTHLSVCLLL